MRIEKLDFHRPECDGTCEKEYCRPHRAIYFWCRTAHYEQGALYGNGDCPRCLQELGAKIFAMAV